MFHLHARLGLHDEGSGSLEESLLVVQGRLGLVLLVFRDLFLQHHCGASSLDRRHDFVDWQLFHHVPQLVAVGAENRGCSFLPGSFKLFDVLLQCGVVNARGVLHIVESLDLAR